VAISLSSTREVISRVQVTETNSARSFERRIHKQTSKNILKCKVIYEIIFVLLRTLRLLGIKTCEPTELGGWLYLYPQYSFQFVEAERMMSFHMAPASRIVMLRAPEMGSPRHHSQLTQDGDEYILLYSTYSK
jgi:hypothetical protein